MLEVPGYRLTETIYESENSRVFRGRSVRDDRPVIIKTPSSEHPTPKQLARWRYEFDLLRSISAKTQLPGVVRCLGLEMAGPVPALVLEDIGGRSLRAVLHDASRPALGLAEFLVIAIRVTETIGALHETGVVHKDINPGNIVTNAEGVTQLVDFGIASLLPRESLALESAGQLEGTLAYISPEQTGRTNRAIDYRSDFYSLGMTFYALLTGRTAFQAADPIEMVHMHIAKPPPSPREINPTVPQAIADIVLKLLAKSAEQRYQSAFGLLHDLRLCQEQLARTGKIEPFTPGAVDVPRTLQVPQRLIGRDAERAVLLSAFDRVSEGAAEMILVTGASGIGKSSLVNELHAPVVQRHGYFASGKFDAFRRDVPYESVLQAFRQLVKQMLLEGPARVAQWSTPLRDALGFDGQVLLDAIPELEAAIGKQPKPPELGSTEAQTRFLAVFQRFLSVFAALGQPLVLFLDDLQWADPGSLRLLASLSGARRLLVVGAYRPEEVGETHPLRTVLAAVEKTAQAPIRAIHLTPLTVAHVRELCAQTVHRSEPEVEPLARLMTAKTGGNPFFVNQLLSTLYRDGLLYFDHAEGRWQWDLDRIAHAEITDNVVEMMIGRIERLPPATQDILKLAACTGGTFQLSVLAAIHERTAKETAAELWDALKEGLIVPVNDRYRAVLSEADAEAVSYRFLHDRVQQSAHEMIPVDERKSVHLKIARLLARTLEGDALLFDLVGHYEEGKELVSDPDEQVSIAELCLRSGRIAKTALAYETALRHLRLGLELLPEGSAESHHELTFRLHLELSQSEYLAGHFERAESLFGTALGLAQNKLEKAEVYGVRIVLYENASWFREAIECGLECLKLFGIELDVEPTDEAVGGMIGEVMTLIGTRKIHDLLDAPTLDDPEKLAQFKVLLSLVAAAYFVGPKTFAALIAQMVLLSVKYGNTPFSAAAYVYFGVVMASLGQHAMGYEFGQLAFDLLERNDVPAIRGKVVFMFGNWLNYRKHHAKTDLDHLLSAFDICVETGDLTYACYCCIGIVQVWFVIGRNLAEAHAELPKWLGFARKIKAMDIVDNITTIDRANRNLLGLTSSHSTYSDAEGFDEADFEARLNAERSVPVQAYEYHHKSLVRYIFEDFDAARVANDECEKRKMAMSGQMLTEEHAFHRALIYAADAAPGSLEIIAENRKIIEAIAAEAPMNYAHKLHLIDAELARIGGESHVALDLYDRSIAAALENGYVNHAAIANECAARACLAKNQITRAKAYAVEAYHQYVAWGATAKVEQFLEKHRALIGPLVERRASGRSDDALESFTSTSTSHGGGLDLLSVTKASQTISREIQLDRLLSRLTSILLENAGAERGVILLREGEELFVEASGKTGEGVELLRSVPLRAYAEASAAIVESVAKTHEPVVLDDASVDRVYGSDPHVLARKVKSLACVPAMNQGRLVGVVYLENNLAPGCFSNRQLEVFNVLSTQLAISVDNARLYASLEEKVRERTHALAQAQTKLIALERFETERQMAGGFAHEIRNALAGPNALLAQAVESPKSGGSIPRYNAGRLAEILTLVKAASPEQIEPLKAVLRDVFASEEHLDEILRIVRRAASRALSLTNELLAYAKTGQEEASPRPVDVNAVVRDLLADLRPELKEREIRVDLVLDDRAPRLFGGESHVHSLVRNLLHNARDAVEGQPAGARTITIRTDRVDGKTRIEVADYGVGIPKEHIGRVFEPFFSTKPDVGTGLGLSLVKKIVSLYDGDIAVESEVGKGTRVMVDLPERVAAGVASGVTSAPGLR